MVLVVPMHMVSMFVRFGGQHIAILVITVYEIQMVQSSVFIGSYSKNSIDNYHTDVPKVLSVTREVTGTGDCGGI